MKRRTFGYVFVVAVVERYQAAWNIVDRDERAANSSGAFATDGSYVDLTIDIAGRAILVDAAEQHREQHRVHQSVVVACALVGDS